MNKQRRAKRVGFPLESCFLYAGSGEKVILVAKSSSGRSRAVASYTALAIQSSACSIRREHRTGLVSRTTWRKETNVQKKNGALHSIGAVALSLDRGQEKVRES